MKNIIIAAATATLLTAAAASANGLAVLGGVEYTVEAEVLEATAGVEYAVGDLTLTPLLTLNDAAGDFEFVNAELTVGYTVSPVVGVYATVETDSDWDYAETTLGVAFRF